ncbi:hypothetical protein niasHT_018033 [Heterodera trifolii]|uniref:Uncharacterized protein n=1 Tax=Heterodera trifolii TaxID=157864 RepID=A0ABD2L9L3_9BILA
MAAPSIRLITTSKAPPATGHSQAVLLNNQTLYISGQTGMISGKTDVVPGGARAEAKQAMTNIGEILTYAGSSFKHVINCNIMVADMSDFQAVNETIKNFFTEDTPCAQLLPSGQVAEERVRHDRRGGDRSGPELS